MPASVEVKRIAFNSFIRLHTSFARCFLNVLTLLVYANGAFIGYSFINSTTPLCSIIKCFEHNFYINVLTVILKIYRKRGELWLSKKICSNYHGANGFFSSKELFITKLIQIASQIASQSFSQKWLVERDSKKLCDQ